jgi:hypothetical protein
MPGMARQKSLLQQRQAFQTAEDAEMRRRAHELLGSPREI